MKTQILALITVLSFFGILNYSCNKDSDDTNGIEIQDTVGTFIDSRDGQEYKWVRIGDQIWMAENLRTTIYNDGTAIPNVTDDDEWSDLSTGAYCNYNNTTNADTIAIYGRLYNWYAVNTGKLAPEGWHVPTDDEWTELIDYLGGEDIAGGKLKETDTIHWNSPNTGATNESGFTALPGGYRKDYFTEFRSFGLSGFWWSATEYPSHSAWRLLMKHNSCGVNRNIFLKKNGFSVRCIKD